MNQAQPLYDIYFTGQLVDGTNTQTAINNLAHLFKSTPEKIAALFNGKPQALKRGVDKAQALKYKTALHKAGVLVAFKAHQATHPVANIKNNGNNSQPLSDDSSAANATATDNIDFTLAPTGSDLLKENERKPLTEQNIDTSAIKMVSTFIEPEPIEREVPPAPDTSHLSAAAAGEDLLIEKPEPPPPLPLDLDSISLAPVGADLEQLQDELSAVVVDTSALSIAQAGADILEGQSKPPVPPPPTTDHLSLD